ncbi:hypothetical protein SAMN04488543_3696 [Friedmanniella luteola]|uniref:Glyoxalase/fosfomycin resistance/dioxygenase domain-containing protein n=1 Tax=Friedmanniella luteola TaxID=546871 RepID=A0A1H1ZCV1_9ACTN|nr:VOC family protein [Friedmanniella luteola]SDT31615.1 hypothetical protein SAMN04488543_3696 [Friedmanniella luteola]
MAGERTHPVLTVPDLDAALAFYAALGFRRTYRQLRPNPYAVVERGDIALHLSGVDGVDPATSLGSVIVVVPDTEQLYAAFAAGLRTAYGRLPSAGIPRILRPRRKQGTAAGFSVVDVGGNWLRFYRAGDVEEEAGTRSTGLARVLEVAARQGDARGDDAQALDVLDRGLARHGGAGPAERVPALLYRVELLVRLGRRPEAARVLTELRAGLDAAGAVAFADGLEHARQVLGPEPTGGPG